jgi:hypothetical protein
LTGSGSGVAKTREEWIATRLARYSEAVALVDAGKAPGRVSEAVALVRQGLKGAEIAEAMGIGRSQVFALLKDPLGVQARERKGKRYGLCADCGRKVFNSGSYDIQERCAACHGLHQRAQSAAWIIEAIQDWHERYGVPPSAQDWNTAPSQLEQMHPERRLIHQARIAERKWPRTSSVQSAFGTWSAAIEAAGLTPTRPGHRIDPETWRRHRSVFSPEQALDALRSASVDGVAPSMVRYDAEKTAGMPCAGTVIQKFGSWTNAAKAAGLRPSKRGGNRMGIAIKAEEIIARELAKNEERRKGLQEQLDALDAEATKLKAAQAAMNGAG